MSAFRSKIDDVIHRLDHVEVVFDHNYGVTVVDESVQTLQQPIDVGKVQSGRGFIEDVKVVPASFQQFVGSPPSFVHTFIFLLHSAFTPL